LAVPLDGHRNCSIFSYLSFLNCQKIYWLRNGVPLRCHIQYVAKEFPVLHDSPIWLQIWLRDFNIKLIFYQGLLIFFKINKRCDKELITNISL
jgi:hypothetical protein